MLQDLVGGAKIRFERVVLQQAQPTTTAAANFIVEMIRRPWQELKERATQLDRVKEWLEQAATETAASLLPDQLNQAFELICEQESSRLAYFTKLDAVHNYIYDQLDSARHNFSFRQRSSVPTTAVEEISLNDIAPVDPEPLSA